MIKGRKITNIQELNMYCDLCGEQMEQGNYVLTSNPPTYVYECKCGHHTTSHMRFPRLVYEYEEE